MSRILVSDIQAVVAAHFGVTSEELVSPSRKAKVSHPRAVAFWLARSLTGQSTTQIGRAFRKEHSAVLYGARRIDRLRIADAAFQRELTALAAETLVARGDAP